MSIKEIRMYNPTVATLIEELKNLPPDQPVDVHSSGNAIEIGLVNGKVHMVGFNEGYYADGTQETEYSK